ncbi:hypothetical protein LNTAR_19287 [Lentisphaera araneosa HTCC2155]|uniref:Uncharacterized protein n=1 Tax=Lentisphaera araneosa HTCC2155 TaxID=313628 RepID=A6DQS3_9BACT|nr:hypothetical protein LNTAR_19287 [Lentisphaera araneosa HTCC2155]
MKKKHKHDQFCKAMIDDDYRQKLIKKYQVTRIKYLISIFILIGFTVYDYLQNSSYNLIIIFALLCSFGFLQNENDLRILKRNKTKD